MRLPRWLRRRRRPYLVTWTDAKGTHKRRFRTRAEAVAEAERRDREAGR